MSPRTFLLGAAGATIFIVTSVPASAQLSLGSIYLRGDAGWSDTVNANIHDRIFALDHIIVGPGGGPGMLDNVGSGWFAGGGVGTQFFEHFRGEIVYTYRGGYRLDQLDAATPPTQFRFDLASNSVMANGYVDFPLRFFGVVPFVGAGVGWSQTNMSNLSIMNGSSAASAPGGTSNNFGWQAMAGVGFAVTDGIIVDLFYRYFDGGHIKTRAGQIVSSGVVVGTYQGAEGSFHAHELGVSIRFPLH